MSMRKSFFMLAGVVALAWNSLGTARAELVVIVNAQHPVSSLTAEQVADIYLGKNPQFVPFDLPESAKVREEFYRRVAGKDAAQVKAIWARLVFTGRAQPPAKVASDAEAVKQVAGNSKAIAYVDKSAVNPSVKAVFAVN
jgi:ABC-type phosphate transport system substrate-binding protein